MEVTRSEEDGEPYVSLSIGGESLGGAKVKNVTESTQINIYYNNAQHEEISGTATVDSSYITNAEGDALVYINNTYLYLKEGSTFLRFEAI